MSKTPGPGECPEANPYKTSDETRETPSFSTFTELLESIASHHAQQGINFDFLKRSFIATINIQEYNSSQWLAKHFSEISISDIVVSPDYKKITFTARIPRSGQSSLAMKKCELTFAPISKRDVAALNPAWVLWPVLSRADIVKIKNFK